MRCYDRRLANINLCPLIAYIVRSIRVGASIQKHLNIFQLTVTSGEDEGSFSILNIDTDH